MMQAVTSFVVCDDRILLLRRSSAMRMLPGRWSAVSGTLEEGEASYDRAMTEMYEETGIVSCRTVGAGAAVPIPLGRNTLWVHPFVFVVQSAHIRLNCENSEYRWVRPADISLYCTVPRLHQLLLCMVCALAGEHYVYAGAAAHSTWHAVARMLPRAGVYTSRLLGIY